MTDNAERKVREWARKRNGDPLDVQDVVELALAIDDDGSARHEETLDLLRRHQQEADRRDERITKLERDWHDASLTCKDRIEEIAAELHERTHSEHMDRFHGSEPHRASDAPDADYSAKRSVVLPDSINEMTVGWRFGKWILMIIIICAVGWILPYWADSCAARNFEKVDQPEPATHVLETPAP